MKLFDLRQLHISVVCTCIHYVIRVCSLYDINRSRDISDSSVNIVTRLRARRPDFYYRQGQGFSSLRQCFQIGTGAQTASYPIDTTVGKLFSKFTKVTEVTISTYI